MQAKLVKINTEVVSIEVVLDFEAAEFLVDLLAYDTTIPRAMAVAGDAMCQEKIAANMQLIRDEILVAVKK